MTAEDYRPT